MRLDQLAAEAGDRVRIQWRSFLLRPRPEERTVEAFREYTTSWRRPAALEAGARFTVWEGGEPPSHSLPAAIGGKVAESFGAAAFDRFHHRLLEAYFAENRTISDPTVLAEVASESDLDPAAFATRYEADRERLAGAVIDDHNQALERGITAVPTVVVDDDLVLPGALDLEAYRRIVDRLGDRDRR